MTGLSKIPKNGQVLTIPAHRPFIDDLAAGLLRIHNEMANPTAEGLAGLTVLLPNRRATTALETALIQLKDQQAFFLPRIMAIADAPDALEALAFDDSSSAIPPMIDDLLPAIDPLRRRVLLAQEIRLWHRHRDQPVPATNLALKLAAGLTDFLDEMQLENQPLEALESLDADDYTAHWGLILDFLDILKTRWPQILASERVLDPMDRRDRSIRALADFWTANPPDQPVIIAGSTGAIPATTHLISSLATLSNGIVVLPGLDRDLDQASWDVLDPSHPQYGLKRLLDGLDMERHEVTDWSVGLRENSDPEEPITTPAVKARAHLLRLALRPVATTPSWATTSPPEGDAWKGLTMIECRRPHEEAITVALALREVLETPKKKAALVTSDRGLARRVAAELRRWNIMVDDSAGSPLAATRAGAFWRLVIETVATNFNPISFASLCQHPLAAAGYDAGAFRILARRFIGTALRGPRPAPGPDGLRQALNQARFDPKTAEKDSTQITAWLETILSCLTPLTAWADRQPSSDSAVIDLIARHKAAVTALATSDSQAGKERLRHRADGQAAIDLMDRLITAFEGDHNIDLTLSHYATLLADVMAEVAVRPAYGGHPRLFIWGPLEARLQHCDRIIIGGLNEGSWPRHVATDPWMGRHMRQEIGLPPPEQRIGLAAHDFAQLVAAPEIILTRSTHVAGAPSEPSRWWRRLSLFAPESASERSPQPYRHWARQLDQSMPVVQCPLPDPKPPLERRPERISATQVRTLIKNPYIFYAQRILRLQALDPLDADPDAAMRGQAIHKTLEIFIRRYGDALPDDAVAKLCTIGQDVLAPLLASPSWKAVWWPRFQAIADWFNHWEQQRRAAGIVPVASEILGEIPLEDKKILAAKADRIDRLPDGRLVIIDYKTGHLPSWQKVMRGEEPQLPLEAAIALKNGFQGIGPHAGVARLAYLRLNGGKPAAGKESVKKIDEKNLCITEAQDGLNRLLQHYANPDQGYRAIQRFENRSWTESGPKPYNAYDHLIRLKEWS